MNHFVSTQKKSKKFKTKHDYFQRLGNFRIPEMIKSQKKLKKVKQISEKLKEHKKLKRISLISEPQKFQSHGKKMEITKPLKKTFAGPHILNYRDH